MEKIVCQFCYQLFNETVLLQCQHPICSKCAQTQFSFELLRKPCDHFPLKTEHKQKERKEKIHDEKKTVDICCPQCNEKTSLIVTQGITKLTRDMELVEKVEKAQEPKVFFCSEECGQQAILYCEDCKENYCKECFEKLHSVQKRKNHKSTEIDGNSLPSKSAPTTCSEHGLPLNMFCQKDQVTCCYKCFDIGQHKGHEGFLLSHIAQKIKKEADGQLIKIDEQINEIKQTLSKMTNLKEQVTLSHMEFEKQVEEGFDRVIAQLVKKKDALVEESKKMRGNTLSNITLQQEALEDLLKQKTDTVEQANKWLSGSDLQMGQCKQLLQRNQEIITSMLICCESGKMSTTVDLSPVEQVIDKLGSIVKIPVDLKLPTVSGLKECKQDKENVTIQWNPVKCDFPEIYFVVQTRADNDDSTVKNFKVPSNVTSLQVPVAENWKQLMCTVQCALGEQLQGEKCAPLTVDSIGNPQEILLYLKEKCSQEIYERVQQVFDQKGNKLDLNNCNVDDVSAITVAKMLPHLTQLQRLQFNNNQIGDTGATAIADSIKNLTKLQKLHLGNNQIGDIGAIAIANSITNLTQLQQLHLHNNRIGHTGATAIANSIKNLTQLKQLNLGDNRIGDTGATAIADSIYNLTRLNNLNLQNNNIKFAVEQQLRKQFGDKLVKQHIPKIAHHSAQQQQSFHAQQQSSYAQQQQSPYAQQQASFAHPLAQQQPAVSNVHLPAQQYHRSQHQPRPQLSPQSSTYVPRQQMTQSVPMAAAAANTQHYMGYPQDISSRSPMPPNMQAPQPRSGNTRVKQNRKKNTRKRDNQQGMPMEEQEEELVLPVTQHIVPNLQPNSENFAEFTLGQRLRKP